MYWIDESGVAKTRGNTHQVSFYADTDSDIANLPTTKADGVPQGRDTTSCKKCGKGSSCFVIGSSTLYILNSDDIWKAI